MHIPFSRALEMWLIPKCSVNMVLSQCFKHSVILFSDKALFGQNYKGVGVSWSVLREIFA